MQILSHNCYWFQGHPFATDAPGGPVEGVLSELARIYRRLGAGVICLQEVQSEAVFRRVADILGMAGAYTPGGALEPYGGAVLWRDGELLADSRPLGGANQRMWQVVRSAGLVVANVHLPSSRQLGPERSRAARVAELEAVLACEHRPDVVAGDFNEQPGGPVGDLFSERGYLDAAVLADCGERPSSVGGGRGDQIWLREELADLLVEYAALDRELLATDIDGKELLSDHVPLWVILETGGART